jgi:hypothetical protein
MTTIIEFKWPRPYKCALSTDDKAGRVIRQVGSGRDIRWEPLKHSPDLYLRFAQLDGSEGACVDFAGKYGLLTIPAKVGAAERLDGWQREIKKMKSLINVVKSVRTANSRRIRMQMTTIDVALLSGEPGWDVKPALVLQPKTLLAAMQLQLAQGQAGGTSLHSCNQCGDLFEVGADAKRSVAKYCSDKCRMRSHYDRKVKK